MSTEPFISPNVYTGISPINCLICDKVICKNDSSAKLTSKNWNTFKVNAERWSKINIPLHDEKHTYTDVYSKIVNSESAFGVIHDRCRVTFGANIKRNEKKYGLLLESKIDDAPPDFDADCTAHAADPVTRSKVTKPSSKRHCFICDEIRNVDDHPYNNGGLARCSTKNACDRLRQRKDFFLENPNHRFYVVAQRLNRLLGGGSHDIFSADIFYHQSCYIKFAIKKTDVITDDEEIQENKRETVLEFFLQRLKAKIIREKCAFLLSELLEDIAIISDDQGLAVPAFTNTRSLKRFIIENYEDEISFFPMGKYLVVHASEMNPCEYTLATLHGCGLRDQDLTRAFGKMIRRKVKVLDDNAEWPLTPKMLLEVMDRGPIPELFNAIYYSMHDSGKVNQFGYAETQSHNAAIKIWSLASDWESLVTRRPNPKTTTMGLIIHRLTRSKEVIDILHKSNHTISYQDIRLQNSAWSKMYQHKKQMLSNMRKGVTTHSTIDNNDGNQETMTGSGTTHDTNKTLFQLPSKLQLETIPPVGDDDANPFDIFDDEIFCEPIPYEIGTRSEPPLYPDYEDAAGVDSELNSCLLKDIAWSIAGSLPSDIDGENLQLLGSWTPFNKSVTASCADKCIQEYLPVTPYAPEYPVCKEYLDFMLEVIEELELDYIFVHSDEAVYSKLCHILWNNKDLYRNIISLMGGFHELRVKQKLLFKRHFCRGFKQWSVDAGVIAPGSADQAWEGRHYYRCMRVHKECFDALVQYKFEQLTSNLEHVSEDLKSSLIAIRQEPSYETLNQLLSTDGFKSVVSQILQCGSTQFSEGNMTIEYLKDVSSMLAMVSAVREGSLERHLQAEREMIKQVFAFGHHNYARYLSYQHVSLRSMEQQNHPAIMDLKENGFGGSISGEPFSSIHGDLITELFNKETKGTRGPMRAGFSTNHKAVNEWIATIHIHGKVREEFKKLLMLKTSSKHKELTNGGKLKHYNHVTSLKKKLGDYGVNPFEDGIAKCLITGVEIDESIRKDMILAPIVGDKLFLSFVNERLKNRCISFFHPITKPKLNTGIVKEKKTKKAVDVMKEDRQAFGILVAKSVSLEEAFKFPITSVPLAVANPDRTLRQGDKASLRNILIENSSSSSTVIPEGCTWLIDGMAAVQTVKPQETYREFYKKVIKFIEPPPSSQPKIVGMINDTYNKDSIKEGTRKLRGTGGSKVSIGGFEQHMLKGLQWKEFLNRGDNKEELLASLVSYIKSEEGSMSLRYPYIVTCKDETFSIGTNVTLLHRCNHEEADTRLVLHAFLATGDVVIVATDTDVLILMVWAYHTHNLTCNWYFKYKNNKYAEISKICSFLGPAICENILALHGISGCDTTSYLFRTGKVKMLNKLIKTPTKANMLRNLGSEEYPSETTLNNAKEFIRIILYNGKATESYIDTRITKYKSLAIKTSAAIPPDQDSVIQVILRAHLQTFKWKRCTQLQIEYLPYERYGWQWSNELQCQYGLLVTSYRKIYDQRKRKLLHLLTKWMQITNAMTRKEQTVVTKKRKRNHSSRSTSKHNQSANIDLPPVGSTEDAGYTADMDVAADAIDTVTTEYCTENNSEEENWEVSDFSSSGDSSDEWTPDK